MPFKAAQRGVNCIMQDAQAALGDGLTLCIPSTIIHHCFYVKGNGAVSSGVVTIETASDPEFTGDWAPLVSNLTVPTANPITVVATDEDIFVYQGVLAAVRARISTAIVGGTVTVAYRGHTH